MKNDVNMMFLKSVSIIKRVKYLSIRVRTATVHGMTDAVIRTRTGVAYSMQVNGLVPSMDMGARTWTGVAWTLLRAKP